MVPTDEEIINRLTFKVANDIMQQKIEKSTKKIGEFGHLSDLAVEPLDLEKSSNEVMEISTSKNNIKEIDARSKNDTKNVIRKKKPTAFEMSMKENLFQIDHQTS